MSIIKKGIDFIKDENYRFMLSAHKGWTDSIPDDIYLSKMFKARMGYILDLDNPHTFNEKMQWLKLNNRKTIYASMVDKYESKGIVAKAIGESYVIPAYGIWDKFEDIDFDLLPEQFVLKTTHDCGGVVVCKNKNNFDKEYAKEFLEGHLQRNYYKWCREWPYKNVKPRILAEKYMHDETHSALPVYKFFCFSGKPYLIQVIQNDKQFDESIDYFDTRWNLLDLKQNFPNSKEHLNKPAKLDEMLALVTQLSGNEPFIRIDLYVINGEIYFSEYTFFSDAGFAEFFPSQWDDILGEMIILNKSKMPTIK